MQYAARDTCQTPHVTKHSTTPVTPHTFTQYGFVETIGTGSRYGTEGAFRHTTPPLSNFKSLWG